MKNTSQRKQNRTKSEQIKYVRKFLETKSKRELIEINLTAFECNTRMHNDLLSVWNTVDKYTAV